MTRRREAVFLRLLVAGLGSAAIVLGVHALSSVPDPLGPPMYLRLLNASSWSLGYATLALLVAWRGGEGRGVLLAGLFLAIMATQSSLRMLGLPPEPSLALRILLVAFGGLGYAVGVRFTQAFPGTLGPASMKQLRRSSMLGPALALPERLLDARWFWPFVVALEVVQHAVFSGSSIVWHALVYAGLASVYLWAGIRVGGEEDRRKAYWILEGVLVFLVLEALWAGVYVAVRVLDVSIPMGPFSVWLTVVEGWAALVCFAVAIFFHGAFDSRLVIRRTAVASMLSGLVLISVVAMEEILAGRVAALTGIDTGAGGIIGGVLAALAVKPLAGRLDRALERSL